MSRAGSVFPHTHQDEVRGLRGSRLLDRRPPHYRCPAVPGHTSFARAILMALNSSVLSLWPTVPSCWWPLTAPLRQPAPSPIPHLHWLGTPLPNLSVRAPAADAFTKVLLCCTARRVNHVLLTAAPENRGPPGPVVSPVAVLRKPWLRHSTTAPNCTCVYCFPAVHPCRDVLDLSATDKTLTPATRECLLLPQ